MNDEDEIIISIMCPSGNTRWCPTPEQLIVLEELYRRGLRTPNAPQIQKITAHLSLYGNIQGKNVFYWFQNHKARDRQKLRNNLHRLYRHFPVPPPPFQFSLFQGNGGCEEVPVMRQKWRSSDPPKDDWLMTRTFGHDPSMIMEVGPALLPCCRSKSKPLLTLELFPLTPPTATANHQETLSGSCST